MPDLPDASAPKTRAEKRRARPPREPGTFALAWPVGLFTVITFFVGADMAADLVDGVPLIHFGIETFALVLCLAGVIGTGFTLRNAVVRARGLEEDLQGARADLARSREQAKELMGGLGGVIDQQFDRWGLSAAQREVALLVLKGFSYKEIADLRETTERTVRNQAQAIYRKGGLSNRAEMAAFFIEDLLAARQTPLRIVRSSEADAAEQAERTRDAAAP
ncbi:MAG TPA: sigma factor-like helix-turn-helix DNA-binding protein [Anaeromyxobacteraceae bacterium]|nr:sigma factor-like helix-turn-helix DNA-binding protein [Anaeromyxobacteraceae bacterium]